MRIIPYTKKNTELRLEMKVKLVVIDGEEQKYRCRFFKMTKEKWDADDLEKKPASRQNLRYNTKRFEKEVVIENLISAINRLELDNCQSY